MEDLPKTRSLKIMRRVVRAVWVGDEVGDLSGLVNPETVARLGACVAREETPDSTARPRRAGQARPPGDTTPDQGSAREDFDIMPKLAGKSPSSPAPGTGIGRCTAEFFAREGGRVAVIAAAEIRAPIDDLIERV